MPDPPPLKEEEVARLRAFLEELYEAYHRPEFLRDDPLRFAHRYDAPADREVVALIAASFAFGNVVSIGATLEKILRPLGDSPAAAIAEREPADWGRAYRNFHYRWVGRADLRVYLAWIGEALRRHGSLGALWESVDDPAEADLMPALERWIAALTSMPTGTLRRRVRTLRRPEGKRVPLPSGAHLLLTAPSGKSACKRMNLFLRWVCRPADGIDLGLWRVDPGRLLMPLDTHVLQVARLLGLTTRMAGDLRTAREITARLRQVDASDPARFDFSLVRPGILRLKEEIGLRWQGGAAGESKERR